MSTSPGRFAASEASTRRPSASTAGRLDVLLGREPPEEVEVAADVVVEHRHVAAGHVGDGDLVLVLDQLAQDAAHRDHVVVGMGREADHPLVARQLGAAPDLGAQRVEHQAVERPGRAVLRHQGGEPMLGVVVLGELEDRLPGLVGEPHDGAHGQRGRPLDARPAARASPRGSARRPRRGRGRTWCSGGAAGTSPRPRSRPRPRRRAARSPPCARRWRGSGSRAPRGSWPPPSSAPRAARSPRRRSRPRHPSGSPGPA